MGIDAMRQVDMGDAMNKAVATGDVAEYQMTPLQRRLRDGLSALGAKYYPTLLGPQPIPMA